MALEITAALSQAGTPRPVRVYIDGLTIGDAYRVTGTAGGHTWTVRGGQGDAADSPQLILTDIMTPLNRAITYQVISGDAVATAPATVTVSHTRRYILQSLDGEQIVGFGWIDNRDPLAIRINSTLIPVARRRTLVHRYAPAGGKSGEWRLLCTPAQTRVLEDLIESGEALVMRCDGRMHDFPAIRVVAVNRDPAGQLLTEEGDRIWSLAWSEVDDPLAGTVMVSDTWADIDAAYEGATWADLDAAYPGATWGDWNRFDWAGAAL